MSPGGAGSGWMEEGGSAATPGLFMGPAGMPRTHPSVLRAQEGECHCPACPCHPLPSPQTHTRWVSWPFALAAPLCSWVPGHGEQWPVLTALPFPLGSAPTPRAQVRPLKAPLIPVATVFLLLCLSPGCTDGTTPHVLSLAGDLRQAT